MTAIFFLIFILVKRFVLLRLRRFLNVFPFRAKWTDFLKLYYWNYWKSGKFKMVAETMLILHQNHKKRSSRVSMLNLHGTCYRYWLIFPRPSYIISFSTIRHQGSYTNPEDNAKTRFLCSKKPRIIRLLVV